MKDEMNYIDDLFEKGLSVATKEGSSQAWDRLAHTLNRSESGGLLTRVFYRWVVGSVLIGVVVFALMRWLPREEVNSRMAESKIDQAANTQSVPAQAIDPESAKFMGEGNEQDVLSSIDEKELRALGAESSQAPGLSNNLTANAGFPLKSIDPLESSINTDHTNFSESMAEANSQSSSSSSIPAPFSSSTSTSSSTSSTSSSSSSFSTLLVNSSAQMASGSNPVSESPGFSGLESDTYFKESQAGLFVPESMSRRGLVLKEQTPAMALGSEREHAYPAPVYWSASLSYAEHRAGYNLATTNDEQLPLLALLNQHPASMRIRELGFQLQWQRRNILFESGLNYLQIDDARRLVKEETSIFEQTLWTYFDTSFLQIDTVSSYFQIVDGDTIIVYVTESEWVEVSDSSFQIETDTILNRHAWNVGGVYRFWEIPTLMGYTSSHGAVTTSLKIGVIHSFLWRWEGQAAQTTEPYSLIHLTRDHFPSYRPDLFLSARLQYNFSFHYFLFGEAFYRRSLRELMDVESIRYQFQSSGIKFGLGYNF